MLFYNFSIKATIFPGCKDKELGLMLKEIMQTSYFRIVVCEDEQTVELCGALKVDLFKLNYYQIFIV